jgi:cathepsin A (carboxypeptidase C)
MKRFSSKKLCLAILINAMMLSSTFGFFIGYKGSFLGMDQSPDAQRETFFKPRTSITQKPIFPEKGETGLIGVTNNPDGNKMFYWFFPSRSDPQNDPLLIWLTGGPGCSSELAIAFENGPWTVWPNGTVEINKYSWNSNANLLYVDQPLGTGFSPGTADKLARNASMIKAYFTEFFLNWLNLPQYNRFKGHPLFISGESYAGHYIPQIGNALYLLNNPDVNLQGLAIGNGWITPMPQNEAYITYTANNKDVINGTGTYTKEEQDKDTKLTQLCNSGIERPNPYHAFDHYDACGAATPHFFTGSPHTNVYDIRRLCEGHLCYNLGFMQTFFNREDVQKEMGVLNVLQHPYELCSGPPNAALIPQDYLTNSILEIVPIIEGGVNVMFYTGDKDYICNWEGTHKLLSQFEWTGKKEWNSIELADSKYGKEKSYLNLRFIKFKDCGHMVPHDNPELALEMINEFIGVGN